MGNPGDVEWDRGVARVCSVPYAKIEAEHNKNEAETQAAHARFKLAFTQGTCSFCGKPLQTFSANLPCLHWLLRPKGVKKGHIGSLLSDVGYFRSAAYVRWIANEGKFLARINDLKTEGETDATFHWSAGFKHIKWTFSCTKGDRIGHATSSYAAVPHFHFEMRLEGHVYVKFNDFHVPFTETDVFMLRSNEDHRMPVKHGFGAPGAGMADAFSLSPEDVLQHTEITENADEAVYHLQTMITDTRGIPGSLIVEAFKKSAETGQPVAYFLSKLHPNTQVLIQPPDNMISKEIRSNPR